MRRYLFSTIIVCCFLSPYAFGENTTAVPLSKLTQNEPPEVSARASSASAAASVASKFAQWLNDFGLSRSVNRSLVAQDTRISQLLSSTGQPGVLAYVQVERVDGEIPVYYLMGDQVEIIGAGTSVDDVYFAYIQTDRLHAGRANAKLDIDRSSFLWFTKSGKQVQVTTTPAMFVVYPAAQRRADEKLKETLNSTSDARALGLAVDFIQQATKDAELRKRIAELKSKQAETNRRIVQIDEDLKRELDRARKAQVVATQLATMASVLTLAQQVATVATYFGSDTPKSVSDAKTPEELRSSVDGILSEAIQRRDNLQIQYRSFTDQGSQTRTQYIQILTNGKFPTGDVPQIKP